MPKETIVPKDFSVPGRRGVLVDGQCVQFVQNDGDQMVVVSRPELPGYLSPLFQKLDDHELAALTAAIFEEVESRA